MKEEFYLDMAATAPVLEDIIQTVADTMYQYYGNPSSIHSKGIEAKNIINQARKTIADYINCDPDEIIFTSGACEANSLAILGYMKNRWHGMNVFCTTPIEHKSIISIIDGIDFENFKSDSCFEELKINEDGTINYDTFNAILGGIEDDGYTPFVSIQGANSEIGTIQDIKRISEIVHEHNGIFHCDATQLFPYQRIDVKKLGIDMMSMSGQKIHAPKGIGFLYVKKGIELNPLIYGSQQGGLRAGTENVPYIAGLAKAIELLDVKFKRQSLEHPDVYYVRNYMQNRLYEEIEDCIVNGADIEYRLSNNINISFKGIEAESLLLMLNMDGIYVSSGSACNSGDTSPSYVLQAIKVPDDYIRGTIRITLPDDFAFEDADYVVERIKGHVERLRKFGEK